MPPLLIHSREEWENLVITSFQAGASIRSLSREFKVSRNTIRRVLRAHHTRRTCAPACALPAVRKVNRPSKLDAFVPRMKEVLDEFPDIKGKRMFEILSDEGYQGGVSILRERLSQLRPLSKRKPTVRFETEPGVQGQMDWSPYKLKFKNGMKLEVLCFSYILGYSRRQYIDFCLNRKFHTLIRRHKDAFEYFGGVPRQCLYDGEKTVVLRREAGMPVYNPAYVAFITHYGCRPIACLPRRAQTKGKVEQPFKYVDSSLLNGRRFQDFDDLRAMARWWMKERSDVHIHDTTKRPPLELFLEQEKAYLLPLPDMPYDTAEVVLRLCRIDGVVEFQTNLYSVPFDYVGYILYLKCGEHTVTIYDTELACVASHERAPDGLGKMMENPLHRKSKHIRYGLEPVREAFLAFGEEAEAFLNGLKNINPRNPGFQARYILSLKEKYASTDILSALAYATRYRAFDAKTVERVLYAKAKPRTLESFRNEKARKRLENLPKVRQRPLEEYAKAFSKQEKTDHVRHNEEQERAGEYPQSSEDAQAEENRGLPR
jgi:transposase